MANTNQISTRILLRNDELSNWESSSVKLLAGEIALARRGDGSYEMRVGKGDKTWSELGGQNIMLSASQIIGLEDSMSQLSTTHYEVDSLTALTASSYNNGDTAVVKAKIAGSDGDEKYSYTAYVYDSTAKAWKAMDGNYSAENVYFDADITCAGSYTQVGNVTKSSTGTTTIASSGKSLKDVMQTIFTKELNPSASAPAISLTVSGGNGEVGSSYNVPSATLKLTSVGSYTYGPATGITVPASKASVSCTTEGTSATNGIALALNGTVVLDVGTSKKYVDGSTTYNYSAEATYSDGAVPVTNLGTVYASAQLKSAKLTKTASATMTGWRKMFIGSVATDAEINEATIKSLSYAVKADAKTVTVQANGSAASGASAGVKLVDGAVKIIVALPSGRTLKNVNLVSASNTPITDDYTKNTFTQVQVSGATAGENLADYTVYVYKPASIDSGEVHNITIG